MANTFNTLKSAPGVIAKAAAKMLSDDLQFAKSIAVADESDFDGKNGYTAGDTIYINKPARFVPQQAFDITSSLQDIKEEKVALPLDIISTVGVQLTALDLQTEMNLKGVINRVVKPAVQSIAQDVEKRFLQKATQATFNLVGTAGSTTFDVDTVLSAREKMSKFLAPKDDNRFVLFDSTAGRSAVNARKSLFQSSSEISSQYKMGYVGQADGYNWLENELVYTHTRGTATGAITVTTTVSTEGATTISLTGTGAQTLKKGDVFTIASVFAVHPITKQTYPFLQQFVVTADNTASAGAYTSVAVSPAMYTSASGGLQNINALPTSTSAVTLVGSASTAYTQNLAFHKNAFRMVSVPMVMPEMVEFAAQETYKGVTVAVVRAFDVFQRRMITRLDFLGGLAADRPEWACRVTA
jgi:P22 coat protein - gene protein 5